MNIQSNVAFPSEAIRWKDGQWAIFINHQDHGVQPEETAGSRYTADFTIVKELSAAAAIEAFTRQQEDPEFDMLVIDNIEVDGQPAIDIENEYQTKASSTIFPPLPVTGFLKQGTIYSYNNGAVMVRQSHDRTIYPPELTPSLFSFWRDNASAELEWMDGKRVELTPYNNDDKITSDEMTWGVAGINSIARHVVLVGGKGPLYDFQYHFTEEQDIELFAYCKLTILRHPEIVIIGHNQAAEKTCPGFLVYDWLMDKGIESFGLKRRRI